MAACAPAVPDDHGGAAARLEPRTTAKVRGRAGAAPPPVSTVAAIIPEIGHSL